jgi:membrane protein DedA with SNARE-associated domain
MPYREFAAFAYSGAFIWSLSFISLGYFFGDRWDWILKRTEGWMAATAIFGSGAIVCYFISRKLFKRKKKAAP